MGPTGPLPAEPNHLYVVLPSDAVHEIGAATEVADRYVVTTATTDAGDESWTGTYLLGTAAYLELFEPGGMEGLAEGSIGLGFSSARVGDVAEFEHRLDAVAPGRAVSKLRTREIEGRQEPWFHLLTLDTLESGPLSAWLMDFHPADLRRRGMAAETGAPFDRTAYLPEPVEGGAVDLIELRLALSRRESEDLALFLGALGMDADAVPDGRAFERPGFRLTVVDDETAGCRVRSAVFSLASQPDRPTERAFGSSVSLHLQGDRAEWRFR